MFAKVFALAAALLPGQPELPQAAKWRPSPLQETTTAAGIRVAVASSSHVPLVRLTVISLVGSEVDPPDEPGLAAALSLAMEEGGAGTREGRELLAAIDALGGTLEVTTHKTATTFSLTVLSSQLERAVVLLSDVVARPKLAPAEWKKSQASRLAQIALLRDVPASVADNLFDAVVFKGTPHQQPVLGTTASVEKMTAERLRTFWTQRYGPKVLSVLADGDTSTAQLTPLVERAFRDFKGTAEGPAAVASQEAPARWLFVDRPGSSQTTIRMGHRSVARTSPDFGAATLTEVILGGSFTSRLNQNLREAHGYTYGVLAEHRFTRAQSALEIRTEVRTDVTGPALAEMLREVSRMREPVGDEEAAKARSVVRSRLMDAIAAGQATGHYAGLLVLALPANGLSKVLDDVDAAAGEALTAAQRRLYRADQLTVVLVGDRKVVAPQLAKLKPAPAVEFVNADGQPAR